MTTEGIFDPDLVVTSWFDPQATVPGWFEYGPFDNMLISISVSISVVYRKFRSFIGTRVGSRQSGNN